MIETSLVIPCLNEKNSILKTLKAIAQQTVKPNEVIFVDAGSQDGTVESIRSFFTSSRLEISVVSKVGALPGAARNIGVKAAKYEHIVFLDCAIVPEENWIESLIEHSLKKETNFSWGRCKFYGQSPFQNLLCAYSNGQGRTVLNTIPGSMFHKEIFERIGYFRNDLRASEDVIWRNSFFELIGEVQTSKGLIHYLSYDKNLWSSLKKWFIYSKNTGISGTQIKLQLAYTAFFILLVILGLINVKLASCYLLIYFLLRGIIDPIRRSTNRVWFGRRIYLPVLGPIFILLLDLAKFIGFIVGNLTKAKKA